MTAALDDITILEFASYVSGPYAGMLLGDLGAEIIKIEDNKSGDSFRGWGAADYSATFGSVNRNKKSIILDLKSEEGRAAALALAETADVVIENFRPGAMDRLGLGYDALAAINPRLIYCSITGFGQDGPLANRPGYDFLVQAMGGLMSVTGAADGEPGAGPQKVGVALTDIMTGLYAVIGIQAALADRAQSGLGQHVDLALLDVTAATLANQATNYLVGGLNPTRLGNAHPNIVPYQSFVAKDGYLIVAVGNDGQFRRYCQVIGAPELADDERFQTNRDRVGNRDALVPLLQVKMLERDKAEWIALLEAANVPAGPINSVGEVFAEPQIQARGMQVNLDHPLNSKLQLVGNPIKLSRTPVEYRQAPPTLGQHNEDFL